MIEIENDGVFYMSAGETCYIVKTDRHVYYGSRLEPEDELAASDKREFTLTVNGKKADLCFSGAEVLQSKPVFVRSIAGGKTLKLTFKCDGVTVYAYYTPYGRGGFTRRTVVKNCGADAVKCSLDMYLPHEGEPFDCGRAIDNYVAFSAFRDRNAGDAYAFLLPYADGAVGADGAEFADIDIAAGGEYVSPELLTVYSDRGIGGCARAIHDILREHMYRLADERMHTVLFLPPCKTDRAIRVCRDAYELGFDVVAADAGIKDLRPLADECRSVGIDLGLRITDLADADKTALSVSDAAHGYGVKYVMIDISAADDARLSRAVYDFKEKLKRSAPQVQTEWGISRFGANRDISVCYPLSTLRTAVAPSSDDGFKLRFDISTMGALGYEWSQDLDDRLKTAIRAQILSYQDDAKLVADGDLYSDEFADGYYMMTVSKDKSRAYAVCVTSVGGRAKLVGLDERNLYSVREIDKTYSGAAIARYGLPLPDTDKQRSFVFHLRQVADYD